MQKPLLLDTTPGIPRQTARHAGRRILGMTARAFTLLEILVVLAIAGMIIGLAVANLDTVLGSAKKRGTANKIESLGTALFNYRFDVGDYPSTADGLRALIAAPGDKAARWSGPYVKRGTADITDEWEELLQYRYPGTRNKNGYDLWSKGPDKQDGTADDIGNWITEGADNNPANPGQ